MPQQHILLIDDVAKNIQVAANVLKQTACQISFAQSGEKALEILNHESIDLVLLDVMMPGIDGYEVCRRIKADESLRDIPVIFLTARNDIESITQAFQSGGIDYISKPFNSEELLARVTTHLELSKTQREVRKQKGDLEKTNAVKDKLFSIIAHDLRNPFNGLMVLSDILKYKFNRMKPEEIKSMIELIHDSSRDGYLLLENLLEWSRSQRDQIAFRPVAIDLETLIMGNINLMKTMVVSKNISILIELADAPEIVADAHMVDTILRNLITNAIKFTPQDGDIEIRTVTHKDKIEISVIDTGAGMTEEQLANLFKPVKTRSISGTVNEKGTGLGLLLCKEFIDRHNGDIRVGSTPGKGSVFTISLPLKAS